MGLRDERAASAVLVSAGSGVSSKTLMPRSRSMSRDGAIGQRLPYAESATYQGSRKFGCAVWGALPDDSPAVTDQSSRAIQLFNELAAEYDEALPFFRVFAELHADWLAPAAGTRVLDLGAGHRRTDRDVLRRGCEVTAVDAAPAMVARLAALHPKAHARVMDGAPCRKDGPSVH